ncbi:ABC-F family ATP-binding cassette domain-containing protein [Moheibacter lacus]|uniref:Probable ATP-binding protein YbiT n=1 Tax=Moheibacter lacus TaxID=2745851 RepID=A0A838ZIT3_9FLAO|nr:ABC-F family ATP-binding cassette domain-containing protein [Moheibacter lacus]MBA5629168.1 ABC-F family ATP-binding cassette domain-containing protein [Moheibacter lacus]
MLLVQNLGVHFAGNYLFDNVSFRINKGNRVGLAGKNGAGKSTLLKILAKKQIADEGDVVHEGEVSVGFLTQDIDFEKGRTVWEEAGRAFQQLNEIQQKIDFTNDQLSTRIDYESDAYGKLIEDITHLTDRFNLLGGYTKDAEMEKILFGLGFKAEDFHRQTEEFSGGWRMRIELAKLLLQKHDVLLLDEPTNHLDIDSILWLEDFLQDYPGAVVLVSHDKQFLDNVTNRTLEIANKQVHDYKANYSKYIELRQERREKMEQAQKNQEQYIKHTEQLINKFRAKASKAATAQSLIKKLDKIDRIEVENEDVHKMNIRFASAVVPGKIIFELEKVGKKYGEKQIFDDVNFYVNRGEKIAFVGQNGQGKTTLARVMVDGLEHSGIIKLGHNVEVGYFAQNQAEVLNEKWSVLEEAEYASTEETRKQVRDVLGAFLFSGETVEKKVSVLSGGERNRLALAKLLLKPFNVLVMDEPTNHLDIQSKEILKQALKNFDGTLILVSHDREFLDGLANKVFEFRDGKVNEFLGGITEYLAERKAQGFREIEKVETQSIASVQSELKKEKVQLSQEEIKEQKRIKNKITKLEEEIADLESKIADLEKKFETSHADEDLKKYDELKLNLEDKMQEWEELMMLI